MADGFYTHDEDLGCFGGYASDGADNDGDRPGFGGGFFAGPRSPSGGGSAEDDFGACGRSKTAARSGFFSSFFRGGDYRRAA